MLKSLLRSFFVLTLVLGFFIPLSSLHAKQKLQEEADPDAITTLAKQALLIDKATGAVLFEKNAKEKMPTSSMSKMVFAYAIFKALEAGKIKPNDIVIVSEKARKMTGSRMFLEVNSRVTIDELVHGLIIQSGNDAAIALAEGIWGSEEAAVAAMNQVAIDLGLKDSHFTNVVGYHEDGHYMTCYDLAKIAMHLMDDFPKFYKLFGKPEYTYNGITQANRNPLMKFAPPGDGLKTGYTHKGGYGLTGSVYKDSKRLILVLNGLPTMWNREMESRKLLEWGFEKYKSYPIFTQNEVVDVADVWLGDKDATRLVIKDNVIANVFWKQKHELKVELIYDSPLKAPLSPDVPVGELRVSAPGMSDASYPIYPQDKIDKVAGFNRISSAFNYLVYGSNKGRLIDRDPNQVDLPEIKYN